MLITKGDDFVSRGGRRGVGEGAMRSLSVMEEGRKGRAMKALSVVKHVRI